MQYCHKASVTVFVSLSLSTFIMLILTMIFLCIDNGKRIRFDGITDIAMNSVLGEYSKSLYDEFGLLYLDASYLGMTPGVENIRARIMKYFGENANSNQNQGLFIGSLGLNEAEIAGIQSACSKNGESLRSQIGHYLNDSGHFNNLLGNINCDAVSSYLDMDVLGDFRALMESIEGMELPKLENPETGILEEVPLDNPAEEVFSQIGCDILYLTNADLSSLTNITVDTGNLISHKSPTNTCALGEFEHIDNVRFSEYIFEKMGRFRHNRNHLLTCECEYIVCGHETDLKNLSDMANRIFAVTLAQNYMKDQSDSGLKAMAYATATALAVCTLSPEFIEPVAKSIVYAHTFTESVKDMNEIMNGGSGKAGITYDEFLGAFLILTDEVTMNFRTMDLMEMQVRKDTMNQNFSMDWCIERLKIHITGGPGNYNINRTYGYY